MHWVQMTDCETVLFLFVPRVRQYVEGFTLIAVEGV